nr:brassinosteroid LRR receptor kinase BRI1-like [Lolium perenne]
MELLDLSGNNISGEVVSGVLSGCRALVALDLSNNHLTGAFPPDILGLASLSYLNLSFNNFSGGLPSGESLAAGLPRVTTVSLSFNYFNGSLPDTMGALAELTTLELSSNALTGTIPPSLCPSTGISKLEVLHLQNNYLTGGIPLAISNCRNLQSLNLALNFINGSIPTSLGDLRLLQDLMLWENKLEGNIPASLAGARGLQNLILDYNGLTGSIPSGLVNCEHLIWLSLGSNKLSGPVPAWLGRLGNLVNLKLNKNSFSGPIPRELGDCQRLVHLDLNDNQLNGPIPPELARQSGKIPMVVFTGRTIAYLRNQEPRSNDCHSRGDLLETSGVRTDDLNRMTSKKLCNFTVMYLSSGEFTFSSGYLDLSFNQLDSEIPKELGKMNYLTVLNLGNNLLSGAIPDELGDAKKLLALDLSHNQLEGPIPGSFSTLALAEIDLSYNKLNGSVPVLGPLVTFPESQYANNSGLCGIPLPPCQPISSLQGGHRSGHNYHLMKMTILLAGITLAIGVIAFCLYLGIVKKTEKGEVRASVDYPTDPAGHKFISHLELVRATNHFNEDNMLGSGGFGKVFKGQLSSGLVVAVKVLDMRFKHATRSFDAECRVLRMARHRNLMEIISTCSNMDFRALVLRYMPNSSLDTLLHRSQLRERQFGFGERLGVMLDVAMALEYLHHRCHEVVLHCDLKPSNVLFDEHMIAHVADFGIAMLLQGNDSSMMASNMPGSVGYMSPEYGSYGKASRKSDVFSYGIMLLEVFTGRKPEDAMFVGDLTLRRWVQQLFPAELVHVVDTRLLHGSSSWCELHDSFLVPIIETGLFCTKDSPNDRIKMSDVVPRLTKIQMEYTKWETRHNDV